MAKKSARRKVPVKPAKAKAAVPPATVDLAQAFRQSYQAPPAPASVTVVLDPDVALHFQNARAVNEALRALLRIVKQVRN